MLTNEVTNRNNRKVVELEERTLIPEREIVQEMDRDGSTVAIVVFEINTVHDTMVIVEVIIHIT